MLNFSNHLIYSNSALFKQSTASSHSDLPPSNYEEKPVCDLCKNLSVKHILIECPILKDIRQYFYLENILKDIFKKVSLVTRMCCY